MEQFGNHPVHLLRRNAVIRVLLEFFHPQFLCVNNE